MPPILWEVISVPYVGVRLRRGNNKWIDDQGLDCGLRQNLRHADIGIATGGNVDKYYVCGIFRSGGADMEFANSFDGHSREKKPIFYLKAC